MKTKLKQLRGIHLLNLLDGKNLESVPKPSPKKHLLINVTCIRMLA
jgi:hypothetical protein